jgi:hypothetical protein
MACLCNLQQCGLSKQPQLDLRKPHPDLVVGRTLSALTGVGCSVNLKLRYVTLNLGGLSRQHQAELRKPYPHLSSASLLQVEACLGHLNLSYVNHGKTSIMFIPLALLQRCGQFRQHKVGCCEPHPALSSGLITSAGLHRGGLFKQPHDILHPQLTRTAY